MGRAATMPMFLAEIAAAMGQTAGMRRFGTAAWISPMSRPAASMAIGNVVCMPWDMAAGILLVREAGGVVTDLDGGTRSLENGHILAANEPLHPQVLKLLKDAGRAAKG